MTEPAITDVQAQYDLLDITLEAFDQEALEQRGPARHALNQWIETVREAGFPVLAYELEKMQIAVEKADAAQIKESLLKAGILTLEAANKADGMMKKKIVELAEALTQAGEDF